MLCSLSALSLGVIHLGYQVVAIKNDVDSTGSLGILSESFQIILFLHHGLRCLRRQLTSRKSRPPTRFSYTYNPWFLRLMAAEGN